MKPKILLNAGVAFAGTTPFYYTLRNAKFCHAGYKKEFHYLQMMHTNQEGFTDWMTKRYTERRPDFRTGELPEVTAEYDKDYYQTLLEPEHSFDKYIGHMKYMSEKYPEYHAVCDFSNYIITLPEEFLTAHANALKPHFDVRVTILLADPVFRYYQECGGLINQYHSSEQKRKKMKFANNNDIMYNYYIRTKQHHKLFLWFIERLQFSTNCNYEENCENIIKSYGKKNVLVLEMEKLWNSSYHNEIFDRLSEFLDYDISPRDLYPNQYMSEDKNIEGLRDQNTEFEPLTEKLYNLGKKAFERARSGEGPYL